MSAASTRNKDDDKARYSTFKIHGSFIQFTKGIVNHDLGSKIQYTGLE